MKTRFGKIPFDQLTDAEKEAVYKGSERIDPRDGKPLTSKDRLLHRQAGLRPGRPRVGMGARRINISVERGLLSHADAFARRHGISRAKLFAQCVKAFLSNAA
jgi:hypothetical protein